MKQSSATHGNALLLILVAIALIAALTMTVMRSDVSDSDAIAPEQAKILASRAMAQARLFEEATKTLISKGCSEQQLNFVNPVVTSPDYTNASAPSDKSCDIFAAEGAGLGWPIPPANANDGSNWLLLAGNAVNGLGLTDDGSCSSGCIDLMAVLPHISLNVCKQLNALAGVTEASATPPVDAGDFDATTILAGFDGSATGVAVGDSGDILKGKHTGCFEATTVDGGGAAGTYWFYHVLVVR